MRCFGFVLKKGGEEKICSVRRGKKGEGGGRVCNDV